MVPTGDRPFEGGPFFVQWTCMVAHGMLPAYLIHDGEEEAMPTGVPKTPAEKRADVLMEHILDSVKELQSLVYAGQQDHRKVERVLTELNGGPPTQKE